MKPCFLTVPGDIRHNGKVFSEKSDDLYKINKKELYFGIFLTCIYFKIAIVVPKKGRLWHFFLLRSLHGRDLISVSMDRGSRDNKNMGRWEWKEKGEVIIYEDFSNRGCWLYWEPYGSRTAAGRL